MIKRAFVQRTMSSYGFVILNDKAGILMGLICGCDFQL